MADHNDFGKKAEDLAAEYLREKGFRILVRNFVFQKAEIDIIAKTEHLILIVEVKARATDAFLEPQEAVTKKKIKLLVNAADEFLKENDISEEVRFDIISVIQAKDRAPQITHIESAFEAYDAN